MNFSKRCHKHVQNKYDCQTWNTKGIIDVKEKHGIHQNRMSNIIRHRSWQIFHVKILLHAFQVTPFFTKIGIKTQIIQVGNCQFVSVFFIIPVIIDIHRHRFEIYTLVSEIHENVDLVLGIKNVFELEGVINSQDCCFKFLNRSLPIFPKEHIMLKPKEQKLIEVKALFIDEISGLAIIKILVGSTYSTMLLKLKFIAQQSSIR